MGLKSIEIKNHPILGNLSFDFINKKTNKEHKVIALVGENGCGKTTLLNEIYNYEKSNYIFNKENDLDDNKILYLKQGSLYHTSINEIKKLINGSNSNINNFNNLNNDQLNLDVFNKLNNEIILNIIKNNNLSEIYCSDELSKLIDGKHHGYNISRFSSGEQEILLKLKNIKENIKNIKLVLIDEIETSLHPKWQKQIIDILKNFYTNNNLKPQIFIATHSERILESLLNEEDTLIIRLFKDKNIIKSENITELDYRLPYITFAELDYLIFNMPTLEYHDQLYAEFNTYYEGVTICSIDRKIEKLLKKIYGKNNYDQYLKERITHHFNKEIITRTLPTYIRNYFHHPSEIIKPTEEELILSIELLRNLINYKKHEEELTK